MDESWRMRMGISAGAGDLLRRTSEKKPPELEPEDFDDVFGGPPKSVRARKLSADFTNAERFYREIFCQAESPAPTNFAGRRLPEFVIPDRSPRRREWAKCKGKCMLRSRSASWSAQSFDELGLAGELSPYSPAVGSYEEDHEDVALSSCTSKLRPINVPNRWSSLCSTRKHKKQELPPFGCTQTAYMNDHGNACNNYTIESFNPRFSHKVTSFETTNMGPTSLALPAMDDYDMQQLESPSSAASSVSQAKTTGFSRDEVIGMNSWAPEVNNNSEEIDICEAVAWAKQKFQGWSLDHEASLGGEESNILGERQGDC
ncbi:hypothetical protein Cgig2_029273 [Carnegiea gigantea]|uniref:Uncharacterized protein n=1 Tax=Carnegiea gigantea TaxID=171969 RepID=A0A9Q1QQF2_9CARY|nr:hypothetical protein Cgig2_029273 [Carnegiea gigantea]